MCIAAPCWSSLFPCEVYKWDCFSFSECTKRSLSRTVQNGSTCCPCADFVLHEDLFFQDNGFRGSVLFGFSFCEEQKWSSCLSVCLSVCFDAASGLVLLLQKEEQWLNRSAPSFAKWRSVCCQVNQLRGSALCLPACLFCRLIFKRSGWRALHLPAWRFSWEREGGNTAVYVTPNSVFPCSPEYVGKQHCGCTHTGPWVYICMSSVENDFSW